MSEANDEIEAQINDLIARMVDRGLELWRDDENGVSFKATGRLPHVADRVFRDWDDVATYVTGETDGRGTYYLVVEEWEYPTESGQEPVDSTFDNKAAALALCERLAHSEAPLFTASVQQETLPPARCEDGVILTTRMGLDPFYYYARVLTVTSAAGSMLRAINQKAKENHDHQTH